MQVQPHGPDWGASVLPEVHRLLAAHVPQVTSGLRAAYNEAVGALHDQVRRMLGLLHALKQLVGSCILSPAIYSD